MVRYFCVPLCCYCEGCYVDTSRNICDRSDLVRVKCSEFRLRQLDVFLNLFLCCYHLLQCFVCSVVGSGV